MTVYAEAGERITCTNGHVIAEFIETVHVGQTKDIPNQIGHWRDPEPPPQTVPQDCACCICGALWFNEQNLFFVEGEWRRAKEPGPKVKTCKPGECTGDLGWCCLGD